MSKSNKEHLLLAPLGKSPGAVLSLIEWLNNRNKWPEEAQNAYPQIPPVTHLWIVTTDSTDTTKNLNLVIEEMERDYPNVKQRSLVTVGAGDIHTKEHHQKVAEILYRLVLQGENWRKDDINNRKFSVSISGGRKTMSADLQRACTFFAADHVVQMVYDGEYDPSDIDSIRDEYDQHFPVCVTTEPTPWRDLLEQPWKEINPNILLNSSTFGLSDNWTEDTDPNKYPHNVTPNAVPEQPDFKLVQGLDKISRNASEFAVKALGCGVGGSFLRHDLGALVKELANAHNDIRELKAIKSYIGALGIMLKNPDNLQGTIRFDEFISIIDDALIMGIGSIVPRQNDGLIWKNHSFEFTITCNGISPDTRLRGLKFDPNDKNNDANGWLLILRNLIANIKRHGAKNAQGLTSGTLDVSISNGDCVLTITNTIPDLSFLRKIVNMKNGELPSLLDPFRTNGNGDGLGLYTVLRTITYSDGIELKAPRIEPWPLDDWEMPSEPARFVVKLIVPIV